jgi:hypothetical protein
MANEDSASIAERPTSCIGKGKRHFAQNYHLRANGAAQATPNEPEEVDRSSQAFSYGLVKIEQAREPYDLY